MQRGQLPRTCPTCKPVRRARAVPVVETASAQPVVEAAVAEPVVERCGICDRPTHVRSQCQFIDFSARCCCCRDEQPAPAGDDFGVPF